MLFFECSSVDATPVGLVVPWHLSRLGYPQAPDAVGATHWLYEVRATHGPLSLWQVRVEEAIRAAQDRGVHALVVVTNGEQLCSHRVGPDASHWLGARLRGADVEPRPDESGWLWDNAWRQCLEVIALAQWWLDGAAGEPDRDWLQDRLAEMTLAAERVPDLGEVWQPVADTPQATLPEFGLFKADANARLVLHEGWYPSVESEAERPSVALQLRPALTLPQAGLLQAVVVDPQAGPRHIDLRERVLVATLGTSVGVVTETLDALEPRMHRVVVLHTRFEGILRDLDSLRLDLRRRSREELARDVSPRPCPCHQRLALGLCPLPRTDLTTEDDNWLFLNLLVSVLKVEQEAGAIWLSVAGGRKTMGALAYLAGSLQGVAHISHVLVSEERVRHVPIDRLHLVDLPQIPLHQVLEYVRCTAPELKGWTADSREHWEALHASTVRFLDESIRQDEARRKRIEGGRDSLQRRLANPLLPPRLHLLCEDGNVVESLGVPSVVETTLEQCDARILSDTGLASLSVAELAHTLVPTVILSEEEESSPHARFYLQSGMAVSWLHATRSAELPAVLAELLEDDPRYFTPVQTSLSLDAVEHDLLARLFAAEGLDRMEVEPFQAGFSGAKKYWVRVGGRSRPYLVKIAPVEQALSEYRNYWNFIRGHLENSAGRIELRPVRKGHLGAVAYTQAGTTERVHSFKRAILEGDERRWLPAVLACIDALHQGAVPQSMRSSLALLNPLLPVRCTGAWSGEASESTGVLFDLEPGKRKIQLLDNDHRRVNVKLSESDAHWLSDPRLRIGRHIRVRYEVSTTFEDEYNSAVSEVLTPDEGLIVSLPELDRFWESDDEIAVGNIHGDFNLENILLDDTTVWLIDFANTRRGVVLYDYAKLEIEYWTHCRARVLRQEGRLTFNQLLDAVGREYEQPGYFLQSISQEALRHGTPAAWRRVRAAYALNTLKFNGALDEPAAPLLEQRCLGRRLGLALATSLLQASPVA